MAMEFAPSARSFDGVVASLGFEYIPIARLEYVDQSGISQDVVDNITWEAGFYYAFPEGLRVGSVISYYAKRIARSDTRNTDLNSWAISLTGDYGYEMTESGRTLLVGGMEIGYGQMTDKNEFNHRSAGAVSIAGIGGIRHYFSKVISMEIDFRMKWQQYEFSGIPRKNYDYSGPNLRFNLACGIFASKPKGE